MRDLPEHRGDADGHDEVREVREEREVVPHVRAARRVERALQLDGGDVAAEQEPVELDLGVHVRREPSVGDTPQEVVRVEHREQRQPVGHDARHARSFPAVSATRPRPMIANTGARDSGMPNATS